MLAGGGLCWVFGLVHQVRCQRSCEVGGPGSRPTARMAHRPSRRALPVPQARGKGTTHRPLLSPGQWPRCPLPGWPIGALRVKGRAVSLGNVRPHVLAFLPVQAPTPEVKAAWVSEIRKVLTSQLQACRGSSRGGSQPGSGALLHTAKATPTPGAPGGAAASQVKSVTCFCVPPCRSQPAPCAGAVPEPASARATRHQVRGPRPSAQGSARTAVFMRLVTRTSSWGFGSLWVCLQAPECPPALCAGGPSPRASLRDWVSGPTAGAGWLLPSLFSDCYLFPGTVSAARAAGEGDSHHVSVAVAPKTRTRTSGAEAQTHAGRTGLAPAHRPSLPLAFLCHCTPSERLCDSVSPVSPISHL